MAEIKCESDKKKFMLNPITGQLDLVTEFNANKIVTDDKNILGNDNLIYDTQANVYVAMGPLVVTDDDGNVVLAQDVAYLTEDP